MSDLNRRPHDYESSALPAELIQQIFAATIIITNLFLKIKNKITFIEKSCFQGQYPEIYLHLTDKSSQNTQYGKFHLTLHNLCITISMLQ